MFGQILFATTVYSCLRIVFYLQNFKAIDLNQDLLWSLLVGLRFDFAALAIINIPCLALYLCARHLPFKKFWYSLTHASFVILNLPFFIMNIFDLEFFQYSGRRLTAATFTMSTDAGEQLLPLAIDYWLHTLGIILLSVYSIYFAKQCFRKRPKKSTSANTVFGVMTSFAMIVAFGVAARGGLQAKPLIPSFAYYNQQESFAQLSLNTSFTVIKSIGQQNFTSLNFYEDWPPLISNLEQPRERSSSSRRWLDKNTNIMVIILESFASEYVFDENPSYTPFVRQLAESGNSFAKSYANGRRSIDALPAIFASVPAWMNKPWITSDFQSNSLSGLPSIFAEKGYRTSFFHGGENGTMFFDVMANRFGFQDYYGSQQYKGSSVDHDGRWGIFDHAFFDFMLQHLASEKEPFFTSIFTLSSHDPYTLPREFENKFPKGNLPIHESLGYTDFALKQFFEKARQETWFENTLFIITADHTAKLRLAQNQKATSYYEVPIIFYHPDKEIELPLTTTSVAQHVDIGPTLIELMGWHAEAMKLPQFGRSLVNQSFRDGIFGVRPRFYVLFDEKEYVLDVDQNTKATVSADLPPAVISRVKANIQYYVNGMIENRLILSDAETARGSPSSKN